MGNVRTALPPGYAKPVCHCAIVRVPQVLLFGGVNWHRSTPANRGHRALQFVATRGQKRGLIPPKNASLQVEAAELMGGSNSPLRPFAIMVPTAETQMFLLSFLNLNPIFRLYSSLWPKRPNQSQPSITTLLLAKASGGDRQFERGHHHLWGWILPFCPQKNLRYFTTPKHRYRAC